MIKEICDSASGHLRSEGMTYPQHLVYALSLAARLSISAICLTVHSVLPFISPPIGYDMESLKNILNEEWSKRVDKSS